MDCASDAQCTPIRRFALVMLAAGNTGAMRRIVGGLSWPLVGVVFLGAAGQVWLAVNPGNPTDESVIGSTAATAALAGIAAALPLLFVGAASSVRGGLPVVPPRDRQHRR